MCSTDIPEGLMSVELSEIEPVDEFTLGTSTVICMMGRRIYMVTERAYGYMFN